MKRTFLARRNALFSSERFSWGARAVVCVLILLALRVVAPTAFFYLVRPVLYVSDAASSAVHTVSSSFGSSVTLTGELERVRAENVALVGENETLQAELVALRAFGTAPLGVAARVVARPPVSAYDTLLLDQGSRAGVRVGMEVFAVGVGSEAAGAPLGVVTTATDSYSQATLFSAPGVRTNGWIGHNASPVTLEGAGGGAFIVRIARSAGAAVGDVVFVPGPGMRAIGVVGRIDGDASSPGVTLRVMPYANPFTLGVVYLRETGLDSRAVMASTTAS